MSAGGQRPTLLVVDDEPGIRSALQRSLRREPYEVLTAESAAAALRRLRERPVDLVLSDHRMPGGSGLELLREVAAHWPGIARVLLTGFPGDVDREEIRRIGIRAVVAKPWDDAALKQALARALRA